MRLINGERARVGLPALIVDAGLTQYAVDWSRHMAATGSLQHSDISSLLGVWGIIGENIGLGPTAEVIFELLLSSPAHYANIVNPAFTHIGVGAVVDGSGQIWTTHVFGG